MRSATTIYKVLLNVIHSFKNEIEFIEKENETLCRNCEKLGFLSRKIQVNLVCTSTKVSIYLSLVEDTIGAGPQTSVNRKSNEASYVEAEAIDGSLCTLPKQHATQKSN